ncbi:Glucose-methanol-choline oxidoreductase N-terminal [Penicillium expansum]|nr:Glucose-methanol-choline oxidoreductase N-terminal [Penicillium expansum]
MAGQDITTDLLIVGSGPVGATYARKIMDLSANSQKKPKITMVTLEDEYTTSLKVALTCATPEPHQVELPDKYRPEDWDKLMKEAKELINVNNTAFDETSLRQAIVKETLEESFAGRQIESLPLACKKNATDSSVSWSSVSTILGDLIDPKSSTSQNFELLYSQLCTKLVFQDPSNKDNNQISHAIIKDLVQGKERKIIARYYVICGGGIRNPQLLFSSGCEQSGSSERLPALGRYLTSRIQTLCQVILTKELTDTVPSANSEVWQGLINEHKRKYPEDVIAIPKGDPDPQVALPLLSEETVIHRDAASAIPEEKSPFSMFDSNPVSGGKPSSAIDQRVVVHLQSFGYSTPNAANHLKFRTDITDMWGMPMNEPRIEKNTEDTKRSHDMMRDMTEIAGRLGSYMPDATPQFADPEKALDGYGITRVGTTKDDSCVNANSCVHNSTNLYIGGNSVIPTCIAGNPMLTTIAYAIKGASDLYKKMAN